MAEAHPGVVRKPADFASLDKTCGKAGCHQERAVSFRKSLHGTVQGLKHGALEMLGPERGKFVGEERCGSCHATCTDCHLPKDEKGKVVSTHAFTTEPGSANCKACHDQTGTGYIGFEGQFTPSVHDQKGMACVACHRGVEFHGTGREEQRMAEIPRATCTDCHQQSQSVAAHKLHEKTLECSACHVQWYYNCYGCHGYDEKGEALGYTSFNTNRYLAKRKDNGKIAAVVHIPMSREVGGEQYVKGAWVFKDRHSIQKNARQCQDCHLNAQAFVMDDYRNAPFLGAVQGEFVPKTEVQNRLLIFRSHTPLMGKTPKAGQTPDSECLKCHS